MDDIFIDSVLLNIAFFLAVLIRYDFKTLPIEAPSLLNPWVLINVFGIFLFLLFRTYAGIIRFSGIQDALRIIFITFFLNAGLALLNFFVIAYNGQPILSYSFIVIHGLLSFVLLTSYRLLVKYVFFYLSTVTGNTKRVVIMCRLPILSTGVSFPVLSRLDLELTTNLIVNFKF